MTDVKEILRRSKVLTIRNIADLRVAPLPSFLPAIVVNPCSNKQRVRPSVARISWTTRLGKIRWTGVLKFGNHGWGSV